MQLIIFDLLIGTKLFYVRGGRIEFEEIGCVSEQTDQVFACYNTHTVEILVSLAT